MTKRKIHIIRLYICIVVFLTAFFTMYAYRFDALNWKYKKDYSSFQKSDEEIAALVEELSRYRPTYEQEQVVYELAEFYLGEGDVTVLRAHPIHVDGEEQEEVEMTGYVEVSRPSGKEDKPILYNERTEAMQIIEFTYEDGTQGNVFYYPSFARFMKPYTLLCFAAALCISAIVYGVWRSEEKRHWVSSLFHSLGKKKGFHWITSLSVKLIVVNVLSLLVAVFFFFFFYINRYSFFEFLHDSGYKKPLDSRKYSETMREELEPLSFAELHEQLEKKKHASDTTHYFTDAGKIMSKYQDDYMELYLYDEDTIYTDGTAPMATQDLFVRNSMYDIKAVTSPILVTYEMTLRDGKGFVWLFYYPYASLVLPYVIIVSMISISFYLIPVLSFTRKKVEEIKYIYGDVSIMANGDLYHPVYEKGNDEISELGAHLNQMRLSLAENIAKEDEARKANHDLISALSHDLRTPLTTLNGYLEIIKHKKVEEEKEQEYLDRCMSKIEEIKELSSKMFEYALVYETSEEKERYEISLDSLQELVLENVEFARVKGFSIAVKKGESKQSILGNTLLLKRIFNNVFSNVIKYGDKQKTVEVNMESKEGHFYVTIHNAINTSLEKVESNGIGLKSVHKMMEIHQGEVFVVEDELTYSITLCFPLLEEI